MATPIPVPIWAPIDSPVLEAEDVSAAAEVVEVARPSLSDVGPCDTVSTDASDAFGVGSAARDTAAVVSSGKVAVDTSEDVCVDVSEAVFVVGLELDKDVTDGVGVGLADVLRAAVVAARSDMSKDQLSELAPLPTAAPALGFRLNQHGVSEPDHDSLMRAVLL